MSLAKKSVIVILAFALFGATTLRPRPVQALSDWEWAGVGVASYAVLVITLTWIVFGGKSAPLTAENGQPPLREDQGQGALQFGTNCNSTDGNVPIACW